MVLESNDVNNELPALIDIFQCTSVLYHLVPPMPKYFAKGGLKSKCCHVSVNPLRNISITETNALKNPIAVTFKAR